MTDFIREKLGLTQERMAAWLGTSRAVVSLAEGARLLPPKYGVQSARMFLACQGKVYAEAEDAMPGPPPLLPPPPDAEPLTQRLDECQHLIRNLSWNLQKMREKATRYEARLVALPALRAWTGPTRNPAREAGWLALFEGEAVDALRDTCGAGPQRLLEARIAGLEHEAGLLTAFLTSSAPA